MDPKKVLLIGGDARTDSIRWKLIQHDHVVYCAPGNAGTQRGAHNVSIPIHDVVRLADFAKTEGIYLTIVGPEDALALGIVDYFQHEKLRIYGPTRAAALIETSKGFAKDLMNEVGIPNAAGFRPDSHHDALTITRAFIERGQKCVIKADGLASGKGVYICSTEQETVRALNELMLERKHGDGGKQVVIEAFEEGIEVSGHAICSGTEFSHFHFAMDHKRLLDGDLGPNTGGMGVVAPISSLYNKHLVEYADIIGRTLGKLKDMGSPFTGTLFPGLMITAEGPKVLEFNARFGDPETQAYMRLLRKECDLLDILDAATDGREIPSIVQMCDHNLATASITLTSGGYPGLCQYGFPITGIEEAEKILGVVLFHAGTKIKENGTLVTNGGRVLSVSAVAGDLRLALDRAYMAIDKIYFEGMHYRTDIGKKALALERSEEVVV